MQHVVAGVPVPGHEDIVFDKVLQGPIGQTAIRGLPDGGIHIALWPASGVTPGYHDLQAIKDFIAGPDSQAVQIYPPASEVVDEGPGSATHLWVLPQGAHLPYTIVPPAQQQVNGQGVM